MRIYCEEVGEPTMRIRYKKKQRKSHKMYGRKYRGYGQVGRHRRHPGGKGNVGVKDHHKLMLLKRGYEFGAGRGFTYHGPKPRWCEINVGEIYEGILSGKIPYAVEGKLIVVDLSNRRWLRILGRGRIEKPIKLIIHKSSVVTKTAKEKIESANGQIVVVG